MRRIKNKILLVLAVLPLLVYCLSVFRLGTVPSFVETVEGAFGSFGSFFSDLLDPLFSFAGITLADSDGIAFLVWIVGYYICLILAYLVFSLFTFLITVFMDKVDNIRGN